MIYATHRLYDAERRCNSQYVIETVSSVVVKQYPFECEKHSMVWYDAIILSGGIFKKSQFNTLDEALFHTAYRGSGDLHAYGVTSVSGRYLLEPLK